MQRYLDISLLLLAERGESLFSGAGCDIADSAEVSQSILWDNVVVESGALVKRAVLGDNVRVRKGDVIESAAVVCASLIQGKPRPPKALEGEIRDDNFVVPLTE